MSDLTGGWPDKTDDAILEQLRDLHLRLDAPPADLADRALFSMAVASLDAEVAQMAEDQLVGSGARGTERTRTVSFDANSLSIMVTMVDTVDGRLRLDGWLAPAGAMMVELRLRASHPRGSDSSQAVMADDAGRFVFAAVHHGLAQFVVRREVDEADGLASTVITPSVML